MQLGYSDIYQRVPDEKEILSKLSKIKLEHSIRIVSWCSYWLHQGAHDIQIQDGMLKALFGDNSKRIAAVLNTRIKKYPKSNPVLFSENQLLFFLRLACRYCPEDITHSETTHIGDVLLAVTDYIQPSMDLLNAHPPNIDNWLRYLVPQYLLGCGDRDLHPMARFYDILFSDKRNDGTEYVINIGKSCQLITGFSPMDYWAAMFWIWAGVNPEQGTSHMQNSVCANAINKDHFLSNYGLTQDEVAHILEYVTDDIGTFKRTAALTGDIKDANPFDLLCFAQKPMVIIGNQAVCISYKLLYEKLWKAQYHIFLSPIFPEAFVANLASVDNRGGSFATPKEFRRAYLDEKGDRFEDYIERLLLRIYPGSEYVTNRYVQSREMDGWCKQISRLDCLKKHCDGVINYGDRLILVEIKSHSFPNEAYKGDIDKIKRVLKDVIQDSAGQIQATIQMIEEGLLKPFGYDPAIIKEYIPVVITLEHIPQSFILADFYAALIRDKLSHPKAGVMQIIGVDEMEVIEILSGSNTMVEIIKNKMAAKPVESYRNYWYLTGTGSSEVNQYLGTIYERLTRNTTELLIKRKRLKEAEPCLPTKVRPDKGA